MDHSAIFNTNGVYTVGKENLALRLVARAKLGALSKQVGPLFIAQNINVKEVVSIMRGILIALMFLALTKTHSVGQEFLPRFEDVPIMEGLEVLHNRGHNFDSPNGRLVESVARGHVTRNSVDIYYLQTLPSLGWLNIGKGKFTRNKELLILHVLGRDGNVTVKFRLLPHEE